MTDLPDLTHKSALILEGPPFLTEGAPRNTDDLEKANDLVNA